jgi:histidine kinase
MVRPSLHLRLGSKLFLSYALVVGVVLAGVALGMRLLAPPTYDRLLEQRGRGVGRGTGSGGVSLLEAAEQAFNDTLLRTLALTMVAATVLAMLVSWYVARRIGAPIRRVATVSRQIADGDYHARVPSASADEIGELAASFNSMAQALEETEQRRTRLIGDVAHELRTPLSTIRGYLEGGLRDGVVQPSDELWEQLDHAAARIQRLVLDLEELSRVESGSISLNVQSLAPVDLVTAALAECDVRFAAKSVDLRTSLLHDLPPLLADCDRVLQVLTNLLSNALPYTPSGGRVTLSAALDARTVRFSVTDSGIGIDPSHLARVFDRFYRVDPSRSRARGGSGIGLTIARALVEAHGGRIWAESAGAGQGSTFSFTLPLA